MQQSPGTPFRLEVKPRVPPRLARLGELANNLWYSWDRATRALFAQLHPALWSAVGHSPKTFLSSIDQKRLDDAAGDQAFLHEFDRILSAYDAYHSEPESREGPAAQFGENDLVAYFCAEFGFQESLPIYSGGLGILAGDHCKTASDMHVPFVAVGLLYRQGYFQQRVDADGAQHAAYADSNFGDLPISPVLREDGGELRVTVELAGRDVAAKVWQARVGRVVLYLLDTDIESNRIEDREITHRLYGGDRTIRIEQEIVLGIGGVRALHAMGKKPTVWHINEGHAAFMVLERLRNTMREGIDFAGALEAVAASTAFTSHTAVAAGHDQFPGQAVASYFERYCRDLNIGAEQLLALGHMPGNGEFNMTALAARGSRFHNGVSRIHGGVSARILKDLWPQIPPAENPVTYVTNAVHVSTFLAPEWAEVFDQLLGGGWIRRLEHPSVRDAIMAIPDPIFWSVHQNLKAQMLHLVRYRIKVQLVRNRGSEAHLERLFRFIDPENPDLLTIGFGRRFATYKRATLLFENLDWLREFLRDAQRPLVFIFAGKAHPADDPGKDLIRRVVQVASMQEFEGRILFVEGYDLHLARRLVSGVDVWLNNAFYPMEASGTSGMKAGINGGINLSVLDGWWGEGYLGDNGWAIKPVSEALDEQRRNREESRSLYELLQDRVIPLYYDRSKDGYSPGWIKLAKQSMATLLSRYNTYRMMREYLEKFYLPAAQQGRRYSENRFNAARSAAAWKQRVREVWPKVSLRRLDTPARNLQFGEEIRFEVGVKLAGLAPPDVVVELLLSPVVPELDETNAPARHEFAFDGTQTHDGEHRYVLKLAPQLCGNMEYRIRAYPYNPLLTHRFELGLLNWI
jgi:starch phosphorylase